MPIMACYGQVTSRAALFASLSPNSLRQLVSFYYLYPETPEGEKAKESIFYLLSKHQDFVDTSKALPSLPSLPIETILSFSLKPETENSAKLNEESIAFINRFSTLLANRSLKGHLIRHKEESLDLPANQIDIARSILLYHYENEPEKILQYEAIIDWMTLEILAKIDRYSPPEDKIEAINNFLFHELRYRFPPQTKWAKKSEGYTLISSILDSRHGVCLGVSILYLAIAQRMNLDLAIFTPPGHIFVAYQGKETINIETTARGIHLPSELYHTLFSNKICQRTIKEVIGGHFQNLAASAWQEGNHEQSLAYYQMGSPYFEKDCFFHMLLGMQHLFLGQETQAKKLFQEILTWDDPYHFCDKKILEDYLSGKIDTTGFTTLYKIADPDDDYNSFLARIKEVEELTVKYPLSRTVWRDLSMLYFQLGQKKPAIAALEKLDSLDPDDPQVAYYLSILYYQREQYQKAWSKYLQCKTLLTRSGNPDYHAFKELFKALTLQFPKYLLNTEVQHAT